MKTIQVRKRLRTLTAALLLCAAVSGQASALEYTVDAPEDYLYAAPTNEDTAYVPEARNVDRSKNVALIPPSFGSPTSYLPGSGEYLTPNLVPGALNGGLVTSVAPVNYPAVEVLTTAGTAGATGGGSEITVSTIGNDALPLPFQTVQEPSTTSAVQSVGFTDVTQDLYYEGGSLGTLSIPSLGVNVKIYQGTDNAQLAKGTGHFTQTSIWEGNVCLAAHNRGTNNYFGQIHTLNLGDRITLTTKLGTRTYAVTSVKKISETDGEDTRETGDNCVTLFTCVRDERDFRWCVRAVEI